jgi:hypothetical protein
MNWQLSAAIRCAALPVGPVHHDRATVDGKRSEPNRNWPDTGGRSMAGEVQGAAATRWWCRVAILFVLLAATAAIGGCGDDETGDASAPDAPEPAESAEAPDTTEADTGQPGAPEAELRDGENFHPNDIADCLLDAGVGAAVSLDGAALELHDATAQVIVEQGNADVMVYSDEDAAAAQEDRYRDSFGELSEVGRVRNVLYQADPDLEPEARAGMGDCLGI